jgi:hypothetical protein
MIYSMQVVGFLKDKGGMEALVAPNRLDIGKLKEVMAIFTPFIKSAEGNSLSDVNIFPILRKLMANPGSLHANRHAETLMKTASERFSRTTDLNRIFICFLMIRFGQKYCGDVPQTGELSANMETMLNHGIAALTTAFSDDVAQITNLFQNYRDGWQQFG